MSKQSIPEPKPILNRTWQQLNAILEGKETVTVGEAKQLVRYAVQVAIQNRDESHSELRGSLMVNGVEADDETPFPI